MLLILWLLAILQKINLQQHIKLINYLLFIRTYI